MISNLFVEHLYLERNPLGSSRINSNIFQIILENMTIYENIIPTINIIHKYKYNIIYKWYLILSCITISMIIEVCVYDYD